jgi:hypothetical protein
MSEIIPPSGPENKTPDPLPVKNYEARKPPGKVLCLVIGFALCVFSCGLSAFVPYMFVYGFCLGVASLFVKGYRFIFLGFVLMLGLGLLILIIACASGGLGRIGQ